MKVLFVTSADGKSGAANIFEDCYGKSEVKLWEECWEAKEHTNYIDIEDIMSNEMPPNDIAHLKIVAYKFGEIDLEFVKFIHDEIVDYDRSETTHFYVIEEGEG